MVRSRATAGLGRGRTLQRGVSNHEAEAASSFETRARDA